MPTGETVVLFAALTHFCIIQVAHGDLTLYVIASNETEQQEWISLLRQCEWNTCLFVCLLIGWLMFVFRSVNCYFDIEYLELLKLVCLLIGCLLFVFRSVNCCFDIECIELLNFANQLFIFFDWTKSPKFKVPSVAPQVNCLLSPLSPPPLPLRDQLLKLKVLHCKINTFAFYNSVHEWNVDNFISM